MPAPSTLPVMRAPIRGLPLRLRYAGGSAPEGMGRRVHLRRTGEEKEKKERTRGEARGGEEKPD